MQLQPSFGSGECKQRKEGGSSPSVVMLGPLGFALRAMLWAAATSSGVRPSAASFASVSSAFCASSSAQTTAAFTPSKRIKTLIIQLRKLYYEKKFCGWSEMDMRDALLEIFLGSQRVINGRRDCKEQRGDPI
jgi:hypothetical protein